MARPGLHGAAARARTRGRTTAVLNLVLVPGYRRCGRSIKFKFNLNIGCPKKYSPNNKILKWALRNKSKIFVTKDPREAAMDADCIMTDKWVSMNDKVNKEQKKKNLKPYQVNKKLMSKAKSKAIFMHCLPAKVGLEVLKENWSGPMMFYPEIHLFDTSTGGAIITSTEDEFSENCSKLIDDRIKIIGGCCGVSHNHLRSLINRFN